MPSKVTMPSPRVKEVPVTLRSDVVVIIPPRLSPATPSGVESFSFRHSSSSEPNAIAPVTLNNTANTTSKPSQG
ncbi:MAG: hypothetical protein ACK55I_36110, partial [bacterium]